MMMKTFDENTRIIDLTVGELIHLVKSLTESPVEEVQEDIEQEEPKETERCYVYGIHGIAQLFNVSITTANRIKASGRINAAIRQFGRNIEVDAELARQLYYQSK